MNGFSHAVLFCIAIVATFLSFLTLIYMLINADDKSSYSMWVQALSTVALVIVTVYYVVYTYRIADISAKTFEATNRPYIYISQDGIRKEGNGFILKIENRGRTPGVIENISGNVNQIPLESKNTFVLFPDTNQEAHFEFNLDQTQMAEILIRYRTLSTNKKYYTKYMIAPSKEMGIKALEITSCEAE